MFFLLSTFWFIRTTKSLFFWIYLWQLKEYHIGRFYDHFRTHKGKQIFFNATLLLKLIVLPLLVLYHELAFFVMLIYFLEAGKFAANLLGKSFLKPVLRKKTLLLLAVSIALEIGLLLFLYTQYAIWTELLQAKISVTLAATAFFLLLFDVLAPVIFSAIVLGAQPLFVLLRRRIIHKAKKKRRGFRDLLVIGITGSYGKTSTKEFLAAILSQKLSVLKTKEHQNSEIGISNCILNELKPEHEVFICEMGAYNLEGIKLLADITKPEIGVLTGINEQHMATFGSQENIIKAKYELIEALPENGTAFFNGQNKYCKELYEKTQVNKILYGEEARFPGEENVMGAMAVAKALGMTKEQISKAVEGIENKMPGFTLENGVGGLKIIDATYSANPNGVMAHLEYLKTLPGKKVIVMPCLIELGNASKEVHRRIGRKIAEVCDLAIITTRDRLREIREEAGHKVIFIENPEMIFEKIKSTTSSGDVVLLEGRGPIMLKALLLGPKLT